MHRAVLAGCGAMSKGWMTAIRSTPRLASSIVLVGLVDLDVARAEALAAEFGLGDVRCGASLDEMLSTEKPDLLLDVVVPPARFAVVCAGLRHGCHVLSEKPMAESLAEARELVAASERAGRIHAVVQNRRFVSGVRRLRRAVTEGLVGEVTGVHCDFFVGAHFGGFREAMDHVLLLDMAIHALDAARFVIGTTPQAVFCRETNPKGSWYRHGAAADAIFEFDGGTVFTYRGSWCAEGANTSWEGRWRIVGTRGTILWDGAEGFEVGLAGEGSGLLREPVRAAMPDAPSEAETHGHASVLAGFLDAVETGRAPETAGADNVGSLAMVLAAIESADSGRRVEISI